MSAEHFNESWKHENLRVRATLSGIRKPDPTDKIPVQNTLFLSHLFGITFTPFIFSCLFSDWQVKCLVLFGSAVKQNIASIKNIEIHVSIARHD